MLKWKYIKYKTMKALKVLTINRRRRRERQDRKNRGYKDKGTESRWSLLGEEVWQEERAALT